MELSIGIVGLPNVGKSTLFNALTKAQNAQAANYPFCTIEPNKATVAVPDERMEHLIALAQPQKSIYTNIDFIDIAGLVRGASKGEGLGNKFLATIRECAAIVHVVRCFDDENITHVDGIIDPVKDVETIETELLLADIQVVEKRLERLQKTSKFDKEAKLAVEPLEKLLAHLNSGQPAIMFHRPESEYFATVWYEIGLLTAKKNIYCANVAEDTINGSNKYVEKLQELAKARNSGFCIVCAKLEEELQGLLEEEQKEMLNSYNIEKSGLANIIQAGYLILGLISYFTVGPKEVRAWTIKSGWKAPQCAGVIHTDFERGFIRAEVMAYVDYVKYKSEAACRNAGVLKTEGKEYVVKDGDIIHFLFNV